ncbi:hypothetical protein HMPREF9148_00012 [Prevotella sp. F0091]|nr:hypothetical protein HMPREF9148_00012 [Prevotella sp. F0091]
MVVFVSGLPAVKVRNRRHLVHGIVGIFQGNVLTTVLSGTSVTFVSSIGIPLHEEKGINFRHHFHY